MGAFFCSINLLYLGCTSDVSLTVTEPTQLTAAISSTATLCNGGTADVTVTAVEVTGPYTGTGTYTVTAGTHDYTVVDANGCSVDVSITVTEPTALNLSLSGCSVVYTGIGYDYSCATINSAVSGGTPAYNYSWTTFEATESIVVCPNSTTSYTVTVTDDNGCSTSADWTVTALDISCGGSGSGSGCGSSASSGSNSGSGSGSNASSGSNSGSGSGSGCNSGSNDSNS